MKNIIISILAFIIGLFLTNLEAVYISAHTSSEIDEPTCVSIIDSKKKTAFCGKIKSLKQSEDSAADLAVYLIDNKIAKEVIVDPVTFQIEISPNYDTVLAIEQVEYKRKISYIFYCHKSSQDVMIVTYQEATQ